MSTQSMMNGIKHTYLQHGFMPVNPDGTLAKDYLTAPGLNTTTFMGKYQKDYDGNEEKVTIGFKKNSCQMTMQVQDQFGRLVYLDTQIQHSLKQFTGDRK